MAEPRTCPECGVVMSPDAPQGLCPQCVMRRVMATDPGSATTADADAATAASVSGSRPTHGRFTPPTPQQLAAQFPQLQILELLGQGGMGAVYKARQPGLDRLVAIKILPPDVGAQPGFADRFGREARALARLAHPNIVTIHDVGQVAGYYYFVMEYVDGVNLRQAIRAKALSPQQALAIVPQVCEALQYAHDHGVVHRDIKPENILLDRSGKVKIADFGVAKLLGDSTGDMTLTATHHVMGTPQYMAPEQLEGARAVDHRADIYSLGVVFYEMLTGELPLGRFDPPSAKVRIDVRLDEVVLHTLEKEPARRYQQVSEVKTDVEQIVRISPEAARRLYGYDYRSKATLFGWPLVHIATGIDPKTGRKRVAKGVIAIGDAAVGGLAMGGAAIGLFAFGGLALGAVTFGGFSVALLLAMGGAAIGTVAIGGFAAGGIAFGGAAFGYYAYGGGAWGIHALGGNAADPAAKEFFGDWAKNLSRYFTQVSILVPAGMGLAAVMIFFSHLIRNLRDRSDGNGDSDDDRRDPPGGQPAPAIAERRATIASTGDEAHRRARQLVKGPAIGLIATAIANWVGAPLAVVLLSMWYESPPIRWLPQGAAVVMVVTIAILYGGLKLMRLESRGAVWCAVLLAMFVTPGNLIGLPVAVWVMVVLHEEQVRAAFSSRRGRWSPGAIWALLGVLAGAMTIVTPWRSSPDGLTMPGYQMWQGLTALGLALGAMLAWQLTATHRTTAALLAGLALGTVGGYDIVNVNLRSQNRLTAEAAADFGVNVDVTADELVRQLGGEPIATMKPGIGPWLALGAGAMIVLAGIVEAATRTKLAAGVARASPSTAHSAS